MSNVFNGLLELARTSDYRDYRWQIRCKNHLHQVSIYVEMVGEFGIQLQLQPGDILVDLCKLDVLIGEGFTNLSFVIFEEDGERTIRMRDVEHVTALQLYTPHDFDLPLH